MLMKWPESILRFLSYFIVIPGRRIQSDVSGILEINYANGKKILDSANTNYSYGSLQQALKYGLTKMDLSAVTSVLILGLGGGSVIGSLRKDFEYAGKITGVDLDPVVIDLASSEFGLTADEQLSVVCSDALGFLQHDTEKYDLIIVDLFVDATMPEVVFDTVFWDHMYQRLSRHGQFLFNAGFDQQADRRKVLLKELSHRFVLQQLEGIGGQNMLCIGRRN